MFSDSRLHFQNWPDHLVASLVNYQLCLGDKKGLKGKAIVDHKQFILCVVASDSQVHLISIHMS